MTVEICIASNDDARKWDAIISESPHGTLFHTWDWLKIAEKHTNMKLYPIIGMQHDIPIGVFPLFFQKKGPLRMVFSPPPHAALFYLGPAMIGNNALNQEKQFLNYLAMQDSVENFLKKELNAQYISISLAPTLRDPRPFTWSGYTLEPNYDYVTDLSVGLDNLLQTLDKRGRQNLSRARKKGITVEVGGKEEFEAILDLIDIRYAQQGKILTASRRYYLDIFDAFKQNLRIFVAKVNDSVVSGCIDFQYRDTHFSWIGNPKPKNPISPSPNDLLIWESIRYAHDHGCRYYVTMSAAGNKRLYSYYASKFNPALSVRFNAMKKTFFSGIIEKCYTDIIKSSLGRMNHFKSRNKV